MRNTVAIQFCAATGILKHMIEDVYARSFKNKRRDGRPAIPARIAFGSLHIQASECFTDEKVVENISENPYLQYFLGLQ